MLLLGIRFIGPGEYEVTFSRPRGFWLWRRVCTHVVRGSGTVFHYYPSGDRCGTDLEWWLAGRVRSWKWAQWVEAGL